MAGSGENLPPPASPGKRKDRKEKQHWREWAAETPEKISKKRDDSAEPTSALSAGPCVGPAGEPQDQEGA